MVGVEYFASPNAQKQVQDSVLEEIVRRLVDESEEPAYRRAQRAHSLLWDLGAAADILVWTREAFDSRIHLRASLPATIAREGRLLYAA
jgi:hypothetical protein